jgi:hypothetical protein
MMILKLSVKSCPVGAELHRSFNASSAISWLLLAKPSNFIGFTYQGEDIVFRFIIEYSSLRDFGPLGNIRFIFM